MNAKRLESDGKRTDILVFESGEEVCGGLARYVREQGVMAAHFSAVGGFQRATLQYFDWDTKKYTDIHIDDQVEVLILNGDVTMEDGKPVVHAHVVVGKRDGSAHGGHLKEATVRPILELTLELSAAPADKRTDRTPPSKLNGSGAYVA